MSKGKKKKPKKRKDKKKKPKKPKKRKSKMALVEPHYEIAHIAINPVLDTLEVSVGIRFIDDATGAEQLDLAGGLHTALADTAIDGQITAIKAIVLAAAKQHFATQEVTYPAAP